MAWRDLEDLGGTAQVPGRVVERRRELARIGATPRAGGHRGTEPLSRNALLSARPVRTRRRRRSESNRLMAVLQTATDCDPFPLHCCDVGIVGHAVSHDLSQSSSAGDRSCLLAGPPQVSLEQGCGLILVAGVARNKFGRRFPPLRGLARAPAVTAAGGPDIESVARGSHFRRSKGLEPSI